MSLTSFRPRPRARGSLRGFLAVLLLAGAAQFAGAQDWFGVRSGYPLGVTLHYGMSDSLAPGTDLRLSGRVEIDGDDAVVGLGVDALTDAHVDGPLRVYVGGGPALLGGRGTALLEVHGLAGAEVRLAEAQLPQLGLFLEGNLGGRLDLGGEGHGRLPTGGAAVGVNWHF